jgi:hypothetical protein
MLNLVVALLILYYEQGVLIECKFADKFCATGICKKLLHRWRRLWLGSKAAVRWLFGEISMVPTKVTPR